MKRRVTRCLAFALAAALWIPVASERSAGTALAQSGEGAFPARPISIYVPYPGGSVADLEARVLAQGLHDELHQVVTVIDLPGANGAIALNSLESRPADGYAMLFTTSTLPFLLADPSAPYRIGDIAAVARLTGDAQAIYVREDSPFKTLADLVQYAKAHPGELSISGTDAAGYPHWVVDQFLAKSGIKAKFIPFNGGPAQVAAVMGGHVDAGLVSASNLVDNAKGHLIRILAVSTEGSYPPVPDAPTFGKYGYKFVAYIWRGTFVKKGTPTAVVDALSKATQAMMRTQLWQDYVVKNAQVSQYLGPADFQKLLEAELREATAYLKETHS